MKTKMTSAYYAEQIAYHESIIAELKAKYEEAKAKEDEESLVNAANANALNACFDGIKNVYDINNPLTLVYPMKVYANAFYLHNDGLKNIKYVCFKTGIVTADNKTDYLEEWID